MAIAFLCCELLEELWSINNNGYNKEDYIEAKSNSRKAPQTIQRDVQIYNTYINEHTESIIDRLGTATREKGSYYMFVVKPTFISGLNSVFEVIVDRFKEAEILFMLIRIAMHMNSEEVNYDV